MLRSTALNSILFITAFNTKLSRIWLPINIGRHLSTWPLHLKHTETKFFIILLLIGSHCETSSGVQDTGWWVKDTPAAPGRSLWFVHEWYSSCGDSRRVWFPLWHGLQVNSPLWRVLWSAGHFVSSGFYAPGSKWPKKRGSRSLLWAVKQTPAVIE